MPGDPEKEEPTGLPTSLCTLGGGANHRCPKTWSFPAALLMAVLK